MFLVFSMGEYGERIESLDIDNYSNLHWIYLKRKDVKIRDDDDGKIYQILEYISSLDEEKCKKLVENDPEFINFIPINFRTTEMYNYIISNYKFSLSSVPDKFKTQEMCINFLTNLKNDDGDLLENVPIKYRDFNCCEKAITRSVWNICFIPPVLLLNKKNYKQWSEIIPSKIFDYYIEEISVNKK